MDDLQFDRLTETVAVPSRRNVLAAAAALLAALLTDGFSLPALAKRWRRTPRMSRKRKPAPGAVQASGKKKKKKRCPGGASRCGRRCVNRQRSPAHCGACGNACGANQHCQGGVCAAQCVPRCDGNVCGDDGCEGSCGTCRGEEICDAGECRCAEGTEPCHGACIPAGAACCVPTAAALRTALGSGGPAVIDLCPDTTYEGLFRIERNATLVGAGPESTILDGQGGPAALVVNGGVTAAEVRGVQITNTSYGVQNAGALTLVETGVAGTGQSWPSGILNMQGAALTLIDTIVTGFSGDTGRVGARVSDGGGIINYGAVTLRRSSVSGNKAFKGGGIYNLRGRVTLEAGGSVSGNTATFGGGIWQEDGTVTLKTGSEVANNTAVAVGGIDNLGGTVVLEGGSTVSGNAATRSLSGGIDNRGTLTLKAGSRVINNTAATRGGGIGNGAEGNATLEAGSLVSGNTAGSGTVTLGADDIVVDNFLSDGTTLSNCSPVDTIPNCIG